MATRFYFRPSTIPPADIAPSFDGGWTRTTEGVRRVMTPTKPGDAMVNFTAWANTSPAANATALFAQFISAPLTTGTVFTTSNTFKCQVRCQESATNDNIDRQQMCIKVVSYDGNTVRATLAALAYYGPLAAEWLNTGLRNKIFADGDALGAGYTTVDGDRLMIEIGGQISSAGGTTVTGTMEIGSNSGTDLGQNETDTSAFNPWFEMSNNLTFRTNSLPIWQVPWRRWLINQRRMP